MPSDAAKRRKEERAAKRAAKGSTGLSGKSGGACSCCARGTSCCGGGGSGERDAPNPTDAKTEAASAVTLRFPPSLSSRQRAALHAVAEMHGVAHRSDGEGDARRIALGSGAREIDAVGTVAIDPSAPLEDEALCALITEHFRILPAAAKRAFDAPAPTTAARRESAPEPSQRSPAPAVTMVGISLDAFVDKTLRLLELERVAETEQSESILRGMRPETAQRRGRALLGLKCADLRGGLLGKTVLTLELSKRPGADAPPLPPHKLTPHDVVAIRPSKGDASGEPLCSGVVYRVRDTAIEVALDDPRRRWTARCVWNDSRTRRRIGDWRTRWRGSVERRTEIRATSASARASLMSCSETSRRDSRGRVMRDSTATRRRLRLRVWTLRSSPRWNTRSRRLTSR